MNRIIIDELDLKELNKGDIVLIEKNNIIDNTICIVINKQEYCILEELCFYLYENFPKPKLAKLKNDMSFYKLGTSAFNLLSEYEFKLKGDING